MTETAQTTATAPRHILRIDASMRRHASTTRRLSDAVVEHLSRPGTTVTTRDLAADALPFVDETWIGANFTDPDARDDAQRARLALSDALIAEIQAADTVVIGMPVYNFGVPAALKAWIDLVARARVTFRYTENGPVGLLEGKRAVIVAASGGTEIDGAIDFATPWLRHVLGFIGIHDVALVSAGQQMMRGEDAAAEARARVATLAA
ncbi:MAG: NAD(P)H-dependent oxidoreductase [Pseudomonadota bacterium]